MRDQMDRSHSPQARRQYYTISLNAQKGQKEKRTTATYGERHDIEADAKETVYNWGLAGIQDLN